MDISLQRVEKAHPRVREELKKIFAEINAQLTGRSQCRFTFVLRTFAEQDAIYAQGRTTKGPVVTKARGGRSFHNYGLAVDIALIIDGKVASWNTVVDYDLDKVSDWMECVKVFDKYQWEWGGRWTSFKDMPHFQKTFGKTTRELLALHTAGKVDKDGYVVL